jgi:radical SAM superfamily enzyme YgiQ (UPF0313 family)
MGSRVLLISINQYDFPNPVFPLGLAHVDAALRRAGHLTRFVDFNTDQRPICQVVEAFQPEFIGLSLRNIDDALIRKKQTFFEVLTGLCRDLKQSTTAPIILGGSGFSIFPERLLALSGADYGVQGEGEGPMLALLEVLRGAGDPRGISGLVHRVDDRVVVNPRDDPTRPADIATPVREAELAAFYLGASSMLNIQTQRGCALHCCYCTYPLLEGKKYRRRPPEAVVEELASLARNGAQYVFVVDSVFNTSTEHVRAICEGMLRRGLRLRWCCFLRPQHLTAELMNLMARAGLTHIEYGTDSFCDRVLEAYGKELTFDDILHSSELAHQAGIDYAHYLICGGPGETRDTLRSGFENSQRLPGATIMARVGMRVYPGTPLFERLQRDRPGFENTDLLPPLYYVTPELQEAEVFELLREFGARSPNWIFDDPPPTYFAMADRLRARGVVGPLWAYFSILQRLGGAFTPATISAAPQDRG